MGKDVAPGLLAVASFGHTPGHTSYVLSSGSDKLFIQSDVTNLPALFVTNPGWHLMFDQDPAMAEATRRKVYDMLVADKMRVQGFHYPFPAWLCREGWHRLPAGAGAVEPGDLTRLTRFDTRAKAARYGRPLCLARCFGLTVEPPGLIARAMINASTSLIARRRRIIAVWAVVCV